MKITNEYLENLIQHVEYHHIPNTTMTICSLIVHNNVVVNGESAAASAEYFDPELGKKYAYEKALNHLRELEGYRVKAQTLPSLNYLSPDDLEYMHGTLEKEGFDYAFFGYSDFTKIENADFHILRKRYLNARKELADYLDWDN